MKKGVLRGAFFLLFVAVLACGIMKGAVAWRR